jgi:hypothetical protein
VEELIAVFIGGSGDDLEWGGFRVFDLSTVELKSAPEGDFTLYIGAECRNA